MATTTNTDGGTTATEQNMLQIVSSSTKLPIQGAASFGDAEDIFIDHVIQSEGGTIRFTINVQRDFMPGSYIMHIVGPDLTLDPKWRMTNKSAILCREDVDPKLVHKLLINANVGPGHGNFISRYDWKHFRNWGSLDEFEEPGSNDSSFSNGNSSFDENGKPLTAEEKLKKSVTLDFKKRLVGYFGKEDLCLIRCLTFFVNPKLLSHIAAGTYSIEPENESIFVLKTTDETELIFGFIIKVTKDYNHGFIGGDWHYGLVLTDRKSGKNFAFVFGDIYLTIMEHRYPNPNFAVDIQKDKYTYNIEKFLYEKDKNSEKLSGPIL